MAHARPPRRSSVGVPLDQLTEFWQVWDCLRDCGWTQVRVGGDPRFVRPGCASGYGQEGFMPVVPPAATLTYEVELLDFSAEDDAGHV